MVHRRLIILLVASLSCSSLVAQDLTRIPVEAQPLGANVRRVIQSLQFLGHPFHAGLQKELETAIEAEDSIEIQRLLDQQVVAFIEINPEVPRDACKETSLRIFVGGMQRRRTCNSYL